MSAANRASKLPTTPLLAARKMVMKLVIVSVAACAMSSWVVAGLAEQYLPLVIGNHWEYDGIEGKHENQDVEGTTLIWETEVHVIRYHESTTNEGLENYWTTQADGDVELWGFHRTLDAIGFVYDPPVLFVDAPLSVGKVWHQVIDYYCYPGYIYAGTFEVWFEVFEEGLITVPAGTFPTYGVGPTIPSGSPIGVRIDGSLNGVPITGGAWEWWSEGVGRVQYIVDDTYQLTRFELPTPIRSMSWGKTKVVLR